jgi:phosphoesterase RecJ-like protein
VYDTRDALRFIQSHSSFIVIGHKEPDGDCVASQITAATLLRALGKEATLHSVGPFDRPEIAAFAEAFASAITDERRSGAAALIVDCSTPDRTGQLGARVAGLPCLVIDHHSSGSSFGDARLVDASAPAATMLILQLLEDTGIRPDPETARLLLFGLCTDTGFFRHLSQNSVDTFRAVSRLAECGTSTAEVYMMVYGRRELSSRKLLAEMLARTESHWGYRLLQTIMGNVVVALIKEEAEGVFSVGLRSTAALDVGVIAASFGGGGHRQASGFDINGTLDSVKRTVIDALSALLAEM